MMKPRIRFLGASLALGLILLGATGREAHATLGSASYTFDVSNGGSGAPSTGNFGTATIDVTSLTTATITYTATSPNQFTGVAFNFDGTATEGSTGTITGITGVPSGWPTTPDLGKNFDGFGKVSYQFEGSGASEAVPSVTLNITGTNLELSEFQVFSTGGTSVIIAAHLFNPNLNGSGTFYVGGHPTTNPIPEPSTVVLAGLGALGFLGYGLRRRVKK